jgi:phosphatidylserine decarboxylase
MKFHKEGYPTLFTVLLFAALLNLSIYKWLNYPIVIWLGYALSLFLLVTVIQFFRNPPRRVVIDGNTIVAPADGKVVVIEEVTETEYFKDKRIQVSVFMSPINVHVNRFPIGGIVKYVKYHAGLYLVAWHPKSSKENERTTIVVQHPNREEVLFRQIAGALARRIVYYCKEGDTAAQGSEFGFIKFGSRVDILLPTSAKIVAQLGQKTKGGETVIATFS